MLAALAAPWTPLEGADISDWQEFRPTGGYFSVSMPGTPSERANDDYEFLWADRRYALASGSGNVIYIVAYKDGLFPPSVVGDDVNDQIYVESSSALMEFMDPDVQSDVFEISRSMMESRPIEKDGFPGVQYDLELSRSFAKAQFFLSGTRTYMVMVASNDRTSFPTDASRVFDSFTILGSPPTGDPEADADYGGIDSFGMGADFGFPGVEFETQMYDAMLTTARDTLDMLNDGMWPERRQQMCEQFLDIIPMQIQSINPGKRNTDTRREGALLGTMAGFKACLGRDAEARRDYQEALRLLDSADAADEKITVLRDFAAFEAKRNRLDEALGYLQQAMSAAGPSASDAEHAELMLELAGVLKGLDRSTEAAQVSAESLELSRALGDRHAELSALTLMGSVFLQSGSINEAVDVLTQAVEVHGSLKPGKAAKPGTSEAEPGSGQGSRPLDAVDTDSLASSSIGSVQDSLTVMGDMKRESVFSYHNSSHELLQQALVARGDHDQALVVSERARNRSISEYAGSHLSEQAYASLQRKRPLDLDGIRQIAKLRKTTVIQYSLVEPDAPDLRLGLAPNPTTLYAWVITPGGDISFRQSELGGGYPSVRDLVNRARESIGARGRGISMIATNPEVTDAGPLQRLYAWLIAPIEDLLPGSKNSRLVVVPHGDLFMVPFPALQDGAGGYLVEKHSIVTAPSMRVLAWMSELNDIRIREGPGIGELSPADVLIVGNPTMPRSPLPGLRLAPLSGAQAESETIAEMFKTRALTGASATETVVIQRMAKARIIHLATHGILENGSLALAPSPIDDGWVYAHEVVELALRAELAVLSACDTGRGVIIPDGLIGLNTSLTFAGVPTVVATLWTIPDAPTELVMSRFYLHLQRGLAKADALRRAMLDAKEVHPHPFNWAAFTLMGDGR